LALEFEQLAPQQPRQQIQIGAIIYDEIFVSYVCVVLPFFIKTTKLIFDEMKKEIGPGGPQDIENKLFKDIHF
jgi:hypothetical protein